MIQVCRQKKRSTLLPTYRRTFFIKRAQVLTLEKHFSLCLIPPPSLVTDRTENINERFNELSVSEK